MEGRKRIKSALISVFYKDHLEPLVKKLGDLGVTIYSTGGTEEFIRKAGVAVEKVEDLTGYPSILGGRVKTLHPKVFGGILGRRELTEDVAQLEAYEIPEIDLVIVDLYPFSETVAKGASEADIIEKIDIGGISLIRAAAKNFKDVVIISSKDQYTTLLDILNNGNGYTSLGQRKDFARKAFAVSSGYDTEIFNYFDSVNEQPDTFKASYSTALPLRYGENPHQKGTFFGKLDEMIEKLNGKELSFNNILDIDAAITLISDFAESTVAVIKHNNTCGIASRHLLADCFRDALAGDPVSAFGGVIVSNRKIDLETATAMHQIFFEVLIAPDFDEKALDLLKQKTNRIILRLKHHDLPQYQFRTALNGVLYQERDKRFEEPADMKPVTERLPLISELEDLEFATKIVKHTRSNAIVLVKNKQLLGSGTGQTSRIDALNHAIAKAKNFNFSLEGAVMSSDAFFPFPDCVEIAADAGITAVLQPGGSIRDKDSIEKADQKGISMVLTGIRHFKH